MNAFLGSNMLFLSAQTRDFFYFPAEMPTFYELKKGRKRKKFFMLLKVFFLLVLGDPEVTANLYCNITGPYLEGCVICSIYFR
mgnify:CR=1 FL=1